VETFVGALSRNWWLYLMEGVVAIVLGILALVWPGHALSVMILFFGLFVLLIGVIRIFAAIGAVGYQQSWGWALAQGILGVIAGLAILKWPGVTALIVLYLVAFFALTTGIIELVTALAQHQFIPHAWLLALSGAVSVLFGVAMFAWPYAGVLTLVFLVGIYAIVFGGFACAFAFRLRSASAQVGSVGAPRGAIPSV
jgi:uncharacterized membrane protein HdeD (DUF308 family)